MGKFVDLTGRTFGRWLVVECVGRVSSLKIAYRCRCACGTEKVVRGAGLLNGNSTSCDCAKRERSAKTAVDIAGQRFGRLLVVKRAPGQGSAPEARKRAWWECVCDCGKTAHVMGKLLRGGHTRSCGCLGADMVRARCTTHGHAPRGRGRRHSEYNVWAKMIARCEVADDRTYPYYGGRGITVCDRWRQSFAAFLEDMGPRPATPAGQRRYWSIDRIDNAGNYEPGNCRWATQTQQARNKRNNRILEHNGRSLPMAQWAEIIGIDQETLRRRLKSGWSVPEALTPSTRAPRRQTSVWPTMP